MKHLVLEQVSEKLRNQVSKLHESKVQRVRRTGAGYFGRFGITPASVLPTMHGQQVGRVGVVLVAIGLTIASTNAGSSMSADGARAIPLDAQTISLSVPTPRFR